MKVSLRVKYGFCLLMVISILPGAASFGRLHMLGLRYLEEDISCKFLPSLLLHQRPNRSDPHATDNMGLFIILAIVEIGTIVILGSIAPLRPLFLRWFGRDSRTARSASHPTGTFTKAHQSVKPSRLPSVDPSSLAGPGHVSEKAEDENYIVTCQTYTVEREEV